MNNSIRFIGAKLGYHSRSLEMMFAGLVEMFRTTDNWWDILAVYCGVKSNVCARFRGTSISFPLSKENWEDYICLRKTLQSNNIRYLGGDRFGFLHPNGLEFSCHDSTLDFYANASRMECYHIGSGEVLCEVAGLRFKVPFPFGTEELKEIFIDKIYGQQFCHNAVVVDVGAFIGDSSLFFANNGAKLVVAFEPIPILFEILNKNIVLNGFEKVVQTKNEAVGEFSGTAKMRYDKTHPGSSRESVEENASIYNVTSVPLSEVITELGYVDILKMDCEGCEHKALQQAATKGALKNVEMIIMEVHYEAARAHSIVKLLKGEGFTVKKLRQLAIDKFLISAQR